MLTLSNVFEAQAKYGVSVSVSNTETISYELYLLGCRRFITDHTPKEYISWDKKRQDDYTENLIVQYSRDTVKDVEGFIDENGDLMQDILIDKLRTDIVDCGVLKQAFNDDEVQEIQINDFKSIWVVKHGLAELYVDERGKPYQFVSNVELQSTIDRLIYNPDGSVPRMTVQNPLLNARTAQKGYRVAAVNSSATTPDIKPGFDFPVTTVVIRKYAPSMLTFEDFIKSDTLTPEMADFLKLCGKANIKIFFVGPVSSGKTTMTNACAWSIPRDQRIIFIQNPTEMMLYERSEETGTNLRNVLHWEALDIVGKVANSPTSQTMANLIAHTLRCTPDVIIPGEVRTPEEIFQAVRAAKTGHRLISTTHANDGSDAVSRMGTEMATLGGSALEHSRSIANSIDIFVSCSKLGDGSRHTMRIEESTGVVDDASCKAEMSTLFEYVLNGDITMDSNGKITKIGGYFQQVNPISKKLVQKFYSAGISKEELSPYTGEYTITEGESNLASQKNKRVEG